MASLKHIPCTDPHTFESNPLLLEILNTGGSYSQLQPRIFLTKTWAEKDATTSIVYNEHCLTRMRSSAEFNLFDRLVFPKDQLSLALEFISEVRQRFNGTNYFTLYLSEQELNELQITYKEYKLVKRTYAVINLPPSINNYQSAHKKIIKKLSSSTFECKPASSDLDQAQRLIRKIILLGKDKGFVPASLKKLTLLCETQENLLLGKSPQAQDYEGLFFSNQNFAHYLYGVPEYRKSTNSLVELLHLAAQYFSSIGCTHLNLGRLAYGQEGSGLNFVKESLADDFIIFYEVRIKI